MPSRSRPSSICVIEPGWTSAGLGQAPRRKLGLVEQPRERPVLRHGQAAVRALLVAPAQPALRAQELDEGQPQGLDLLREPPARRRSCHRPLPGGLRAVGLRADPRGREPAARARRSTG
jgi:hypothetical protein